MERLVSLTLEGDDVRTLVMICELARRYIESEVSMTRSLYSVDEYDEEATRKIRALLGEIQNQD